MKPSKFDFKSIVYSSSSEDFIPIYISDSSDFTDLALASSSSCRDGFECEFKRESLKPVSNVVPSTSFNIDDEMNRAYKKNKLKIMNESIRPIGKGIYTYYNSLNIIVGSQGKGKSHIVLRDIIQISRLNSSNFHGIVYISKNGVINDSTFEAQRELIRLPVTVVSDSNAESYLKELDAWKELYIKYT